MIATLKFYLKVLSVAALIMIIEASAVDRCVVAIEWIC